MKHFKIENLNKKTNYDVAKTLSRLHSKYLRVEKYGYQSDTIFIDNPTYRKGFDEKIVLLDTIYLRPNISE